MHEIEATEIKRAVEVETEDKKMEGSNKERINTVEKTNKAHIGRHYCANIRRRVVR